MLTACRAVIVLGLACLALQLSAADPAPAVPAWKPNAETVTELAPATQFADFEIQPPKGYQGAPPKTGPGGNQAFVWVSNPRQDGTRAYLMVTVMTLPPGEAGAETPEQVQAKMLAAIQKRRTGWTNTAPEKGTINGLAFSRAYWQANDAATGKVMKGFSYVARLGDTFVQLSSQDVVHGGEKCLGIAEAAVLTFKAATAAEPAPGK